MGRQFEPKRAVEITFPKYGSAYRIGGRLVLTSAHLLSELGVGAECRVRAKKEFDELVAKIVWKDQQTDIALIELPETVDSCDAVTFGQLPESHAGEKLAFQMYGYPRWGRTARAIGQSAAGGRQVEGIIYLSDTSPDGLLVLEALRSPQGSVDHGSDWEGNSGAAIVCDGLVVAVQKQHQNPRRTASLEASPLQQSYNDEQWCSLLLQHGIEPEPTTVRLETSYSETQWPIHIATPSISQSHFKLGKHEIFESYLRSILSDANYHEWNVVYTPTTIEGRKQDLPSKFSPGLKLRATTVKLLKNAEEESKDIENGKKQEVEQWDVLAGLRHYATQHVLLIGKPGSGKSTSLERLLLQEAQAALRGEPSAKIPVLVKFRRCTSTVEHLIQDFFSHHLLPLDITDVEYLLQQGKLLLLLDGLNELPRAFGTEVANFRDRYSKTTPMVVSTRELRAGDIPNGIKIMKMLPLTEPQTQRFIRGYLGREGDRLSQQLKGDRLQNLAKTPLLLWMLCRVFAISGRIPANLGLAFREFTQVYNQQIQADAPVKSRALWPRLLRYLAFAFMQSGESAELRLSISREEAENLLTRYLQEENRAGARELAEKCLQDLLDYHLLQSVRQSNLEEHVEFRHQLIQEYYAAEFLLHLFPKLDDETIKWDYLNYSKWTESIALMLSLEDEESRVIQIVKLAVKDVDSMLGARLAGEVREQFQKQTVRIVKRQTVPKWARIKLLGKTCSNEALTTLKKFATDSDIDTRRQVVTAMEEIGTPQTVPHLIDLTKDVSGNVRRDAISALAMVLTKPSVDALVQIWKKEQKGLRRYISNILALKVQNGELAVGIYIGEILVYPAFHESKEVSSDQCSPFSDGALEDGVDYSSTVINSSDTNAEKNISYALGSINDEDKYARLRAITALRKMEVKTATPELLDSLHDDYEHVRAAAVMAIRKMRIREAIPELIESIDDKSVSVRAAAIAALRQMKAEEAIPNILKALHDSSDYVRLSAIKTLGVLGVAIAIPALLEAINKKGNSSSVRTASIAAIKDMSFKGTIADIEAISYVRNVLEDENDDVRAAAISALGKMDATQAIPEIIEAIYDENDNIRVAAISALGEMNVTRAIPKMIEAIHDENDDVRAAAISALGEMNVTRAIPKMIEAIYDENDNIRVAAIEGVKKMDVTQAIPNLSEATESQDGGTRAKAIAALGKLMSPKQVTTYLLKALNDSDSNVRAAAIVIFTRTNIKQAVPYLIKSLKDEAEHVRAAAAAALGDTYYTQEIASGLISVLNGKGRSARAAAATSLGKINAEESISSLVKALDEDDSMVWRAVIAALRKMDNKKIGSALLRDIIGRKASDAQNSVSRIATKSDTFEGIPRLIESLSEQPQNKLILARNFLDRIINSKTTSSKSRNRIHNEMGSAYASVAKVLKKIGFEEAIFELAEAYISPYGSVNDLTQSTYIDGQLISELQLSLKRTETEDLDANCDKLEEEQRKKIEFNSIVSNSFFHPNPIVRAHMAESEGKNGLEENIRSLENLLKDDAVFFVRSSAAKALGRIGSEQAIPVLIQTLRNDYVSSVRREAAEALGNIASEQSINALVGALEDTDTSVRETVAEALGKVDGNKTCKALPVLVGMISMPGGREVLLAISNIQNRYKRYRYQR